jgi:hypothetical protein
MDQHIAQALQKWPKVPHCYGWLSFDRRGEWRILNEYAQEHQLTGDLITHAGFKHYIEQHLAHDELGNYFFQNGPQRVFIHLTFSPWVVRFYPLTQGKWEIRTTFGDPVEPLGCFLDEAGQISFEALYKTRRVTVENHFEEEQVKCVGLLHDHDLEIFSAFAKIFQNSCGGIGEFLWQKKLPIEPVLCKEIPQRYRFIAEPTPPSQFR